MKKEAFTMIETLVAIAILMIAIAGPLAMSRLSLSASTQANDILTASYLSADAFEYLKNVKDTIKKNGGSIGSVFNNCSASSGCKIDTTTSYSSGAITACTVTTNQSCEFLKYDTSASVYNYNSSAKTSQFMRIINITKPGPAEEYAITITVKYGKSSQDSYILKGNIYEFY